MLVPVMQASKGFFFCDGPHKCCRRFFFLFFMMWHHPNGHYKGRFICALPYLSKDEQFCCSLVSREGSFFCFNRHLTTHDESWQACHTMEGYKVRFFVVFLYGFEPYSLKIVGVRHSARMCSLPGSKGGLTDMWVKLRGGKTKIMTLLSWEALSFFKIKVWYTLVVRGFNIRYELAGRERFETYVQRWSLIMSSDPLSVHTAPSGVGPGSFSFFPITSTPLKNGSER